MIRQVAWHACRPRDNSADVYFREEIQTDPPPVGSFWLVLGKHQSKPDSGLSTGGEKALSQHDAFTYFRLNCAAKVKRRLIFGSKRKSGKDILVRQKTRMSTLSFHPLL